MHLKFLNFKKFIILFLIFLAMIFLITIIVGSKTKTPEQPLLISVCKKNKWGFIDSHNKVIIPLQYDMATMFKEERSIVQKKNMYGVIDSSNKIIVPISYGKINEYSEGLASAKRNNKWGFIDQDGRTIIPHIYDDAGNFSEGLARVKKDGKYGYIDENNKFIIKNDYLLTKDFDEGLAIVSLNGTKWGVINKKGKVLVPFEYDSLEEINSNEISACLAEQNTGMLKCGIISKHGKIIRPFDYYGINPKKEGVYAAQLTPMSWAYLNRFGKPFGKTYYLSYSFEKGLAIACTDFDKCGFINHKGNFVIKPQYEVVSPFYEGLSAAMKNNKWGFIDKKGNVIIPFEYDWTGLIF